MSRSRSAFASLVPLGTAGLLLAACAGKVLSLGGNGNDAGSQSQPVSQSVAPNDVSGAVGSCLAGWAHPNICCSAGPNTASSCVTYPDAPFTQCPEGMTTYPDPRSCCDYEVLNNWGCLPTASPSDPGVGVSSASGSASGGTSGSTGSASGGSGGSSGGGNVVGSGPSSGGSCTLPCPPGQYSLPNNPGECCSSDGHGGGGCSSPPSCACACASNEPCPPCSCDSPTPTTPVCPACPPGWQTPQGDPTLCCAESDNVIECFSQAGSEGWSSGSGGVIVGHAADAGAPGSGEVCTPGQKVRCNDCSVPPGDTRIWTGWIQCSADGTSFIGGCVDCAPESGGTSDGGAPVAIDCGGSSAGPDGGGGACSCGGQISGHNYSVDCEPSTNLCACTIDNDAPVKTFPDNGNTCSDPSALFAACGFPKV
jgi:hypothetical protein